MEPYRIVDDVLGACVVVNVHRDASQRRDLGGQLLQARVVLALSLVCFRHDGGVVRCYVWEECRRRRELKTVVVSVDS